MYPPFRQSKAITEGTQLFKPVAGKLVLVVTVIGNEKLDI